MDSRQPESDIKAAAHSHADVAAMGVLWMLVGARVFCGEIMCASSYHTYYDELL